MTVVTVPAALEGERLDRVVAMLTGLPRSEVAVLVVDGAVRIDGRAATSRSRRVHQGEAVEVELPAAPEGGLQPDPSVHVPIVHADSSVIVLDNLSGLVVHLGSGNQSATLVQGLLAQFPE